MREVCTNPKDCMALAYERAVDHQMDPVGLDAAYAEIVDSFHKEMEEFIRDNGGIPGFLGLYGFPNSLCVSPNAQVVHGIPNNIPLQEGDVVSVDCGVLKNGFYGDHAYSFEIGEVAPEVKKLLKITKESLYVGMREFKAGNRVEDVGNAIQKYCESHGYGVVRELVGHGLGTKMHEDPEMPNYGKRGRGKLFVEGMVVAIDPIQTNW